MYRITNLTSKAEEDEDGQKPPVAVIITNFSETATNRSFVILMRLLISMQSVRCYYFISAGFDQQNLQTITHFFITSTLV